MEGLISEGAWNRKGASKQTKKSFRFEDENEYE